MISILTMVNNQNEYINIIKIRNLAVKTMGCVSKYKIEIASQSVLINSVPLSFDKQVT
jgi:hypothetical protein